VVGGAGAGLADSRVEPEVGGQLAPVGEAADVADGGHERRGDGDVSPGDGHQPLDLGPGQRLGGDELLDRSDLCVQEGDLTQSGVDGLALAERQLLGGQPRPAPDAEQVRGRRAVLQRIKTAWISFLTLERARTNWVRRAKRRRIVRIRSSGVQTPSSSPAHSSLANALASRRSVFARA
jgi:hypothetical protein